VVVAIFEDQPLYQSARRRGLTRCDAIALVGDASYKYAWIAQRGGKAHHIPERAKIGEALLAEAQRGDRILIMGARDDTLIDFARDLVERLGSRN